MDTKATITTASSVTLEFLGLPPNPNKTRGKHWAEIYKSNQEWKRTAWILAKASKGQLLNKAHLTYRISVGDNRTHDADNIEASLKPVQDGLKGVLIVDDSIDHITRTFIYDRSKPRRFSIELEKAPEGT